MNDNYIKYVDLLNSLKNNTLDKIIQLKKVD